MLHGKSFPWHRALSSLLALFVLIGVSCASSKTTKVSVPSYPELRTTELPPRSGPLIENAVADSNAEDSPGPHTRAIRIYYGTDRIATGSSKPRKYYGKEQLTESGAIELGICYVSIPPDHETEQADSPLWKSREPETTKKHFVMYEINPFEDQTHFMTALQRDIAKVDSRDTFVFIHGFKTSFEDAAKRTAHIAFDIGFQGPPIMYSWASTGKLGAFGIRGYNADSRTVEASISRLKTFLLKISEQSEAKRIHLIAHSMGSRALTKALAQMARELDEEQLPKFGHVILAAPDISVDVFRQEIIPDMFATADHFTLYASSNDRALKASLIYSDHQPLGNAGKNGSKLFFAQGMDTIDASDAMDYFFSTNHNYISESSTLLRDLELLIKYDLPLDERGLEVRTREDQTKYMAIPVPD